MGSGAAALCASLATTFYMVHLNCRSSCLSRACLPARLQLFTSYDRWKVHRSSSRYFRHLTTIPG